MKLVNFGRWAPAALAAAVALTGCYKVQVVTSPAARSAEQSKWTHFFIFGLVGEARVDVREFCNGGEAATVETGMSFLNGLGSGLTFGLWAPRTVTVTCSAGKAAARSVTILADSQGNPVAVETTVNGVAVRTQVSPTPELGVVMASIPSQESFQ